MTTLSQAAADRRAEPALFAALVDDAAVFPPGDAPLADAVRSHAAHRASGYAALVGPLLVPAAWATDLVGILDRQAEATTADPLRVAVIGRPGTPAQEVADGVALLAAHRSVAVVGAELGWTPEWRAAGLPVPVSVEIPRGPDHVVALDEVARDAPDSGAVQAKLRTGQTPTWAWPDELELATFVRECVDRDLGFKLTGGLHHVVRGEYDGQPQHGLLNAILAVRWALNGEEPDDLAALLGERDLGELVRQVTRMSAADAAIIRAFFTAYGCCEVTDPVGELAALGLVDVDPPKEPA